MYNLTMDLRKERLKYITAVVLYGTVGMCLRYVQLPSDAAALCRGVIGALFIYVYQCIRHTRPDTAAIRRNMRWLIMSGICLGLNWIFLFAAYSTTTVAIASLCNYMAPILVILAAPVLLKENIRKDKLKYVLIALAGIVLVSGLQDAGSVNLTGVAEDLAGAVCFAALVICNRKIRDISSLDKAVVQLGISALTVFPYVLYANRGGIPMPDMRSVMIMIMVGILQTGVAYVLYFSGMGSLPVQTVALLGYLEPVVSVLCSALILKETMSWSGWLGAGMIIFAAAMSERS